MVDCGNLRCFQERRSIKKELLSWSKKVPLAVGLETIAEHVGSKRKIKKLLEPFNCLESSEPQDWEPEENCFYCRDRIQLLFDAIEKTDSKGGGKILRDHPSLRHLGEILPFCPQFYTSNFGRDILTDIKTGQNEPEPQSPAPPEPSPPKPSIELKIPHVNAGSKQKKEISLNGKKGYSDDDLSAAVTEIRNGKLGTRRAASLYGIPRSTLRNKIFKMDVDDSSLASMLAEEDGSSNDEGTPHTSQPPPHSQPLLLADLLQISPLHYLAPIALPCMLKPDLSLIDPEWERHLERIRHKHNLNKVPMNHYKEKALNHKLKPFQKELIKKLTKERLQQELKSAQLRHPEKNSLTHSVILKALEENNSHITQQQLRLAEQQHMLGSSAFSHSALLKALHIDPLISSVTSNADTDSQSKLVVPEYNPGKNTFVERSLSPPPAKVSKTEKKLYDGLFKYENTRIGDTLKDIIVKTISEKVKCTLESTDFSNLVGSTSNLEKQKAKETILSAFSVPDNSPPTKKIKKESTNTEVAKSAASQGSSSTAGTQTKKTRPKRGQYRKYNSQLLTEAVKAVQRGEMSVHRAGSYYGVPHSTLEYKVKERHLLRQKKIKEQQEQKQKKEAEEAKQKVEEKPAAKASGKAKVRIESSKASTENASVTPSPQKGFLGPTWLPPFVAPTFDTTGSLGMFGSGFALSTPASELLRKLQHKVQS